MFRLQAMLEKLAAAAAFAEGGLADEADAVMRETDRPKKSAPQARKKQSRPRLYAS